METYSLIIVSGKTVVVFQTDFPSEAEAINSAQGLLGQRLEFRPDFENPAWKRYKAENLEVSVWQEEKLCSASSDSTELLLDRR